MPIRAMTNPDHSSWIQLKLCYAFLLTITCMQASAQYGTRSGDWPSYGGDTGSTKYSPLTQISAENFGYQVHRRNDIEFVANL